MTSYLVFDGHNIHLFDVPFLLAEAKRFGLKPPRVSDFVDTTAQLETDGRRRKPVFRTCMIYPSIARVLLVRWPGTSRRFGGGSGVHHAAPASLRKGKELVIMCTRYAMAVLAFTLVAAGLPGSGSAGPGGTVGRKPAGESGVGPTRSWFNVTGYGAVGDGKTKDTAYVQKVIDAAHQAGGGTVYFPPGTYLSGTLRLKSNVTLHLEVGATLLGSTDLSDYPSCEPAFRSYTDNYVHQSLLSAENAHDVAIVGGGTIDGQGAAFKAEGPEWGYRKRPYVIRMVTCRNIRVAGVTLRNSPMWMQHYLACDNLVVDGVTVQSRVNHNNDGLNIDCCHHVRVANCSISSGDDAIVLKSTADRACENVTVTNCVLSTHCNALKLGTETNGGFKNIAITNCAVYETRLAGIALELVDGGALDGVVVSNITMMNVGGAIFCRLGNRARPFKKDMEKPGMGTFENVVISNITATGVGLTGSSITGLPGHPIKNVSLSNIKITYAGGGTAQDASRAVEEKAASYPEYKMFGTLPAYGFYCRHVDGLTFSDVDVRWEKPDARPAIVCEDVENLELAGFKPRSTTGAYPVIVLRDVRRALLRGCQAPPDTNVFLRMEGKTGAVSAVANDLTRAATPFEFGEKTPATALYQSANRR